MKKVNQYYYVETVRSKFLQKWQIYTFYTILDVSNSSNITWKYSIPKDLVPSSENLMLFFNADLMGQTIQVNLNKCNFIIIIPDNFRT